MLRQEVLGLAGSPGQKEEPRAEETTASRDAAAGIAPPAAKPDSERPL